MESFDGAGRTALAAVLEGYFAAGIELTDHYAELAMSDKHFSFHKG